MIEVRKRGGGVINLEVSAWITPPSYAVYDEEVTFTPAPSLTMRVDSLDSTTVEWLSCARVILEGLRVHSVETFYLRIPSSQYQPGYVDWIRLFSYLPSLVAIRPRSKILQAMTGGETKSRVEGCQEV